MIYMRGQARDYDGWGAGDGFGANPGWSWAECLPHFLKHEDFHKGADAFHAAPGFDRTGARSGGEWRVEKQRLRWDVLDAFAQAAQQAGIPASERLQPRRQRRRRLLRRQPEGRRALERDQGLPAPGAAEAPEPAGLDRRADHAACCSNGARLRRAVGVEVQPVNGGEPVAGALSMRTAAR